MVGFLQDPTIEDELNQQQLKKSENPLATDLSFPELDDFSSSFADSFLDFDSIRDWVEENPGLDMADSKPVIEKSKGGSCGETEIGDGFRKLGDLSASIEEEIGKFSLDGGLDSLAVMSVQPPGVCGNASESVDVVGVHEDGVKSGEIVSADDGGLKSGETLGSDESGKKSGEMVSADGGGLNSGETLGIDESGKKSGEIAANGEGQKNEEMESDEDESHSTSDSDSTSSSSSSASSSSEQEEEEDGDDDDAEEVTEEGGKEEEEEEGEIDMEEGELRDSDVEKIVAWSGDEDDDEDSGDGRAAKGPIRSKNEVQVLPPVPQVNVTLLPHHQTLPVGVILSIFGSQVIVEGVEKHNPLNEGSILWITESRTPLGLVDEIFGPVKNPYYMIRYNSEDEIPARVKQGTPISFVPEFANHVLNDSNLYKKGYDASGENDEEISDEFEFSDDEKEAEFKRMQKMAKRGGTNGPKLGNKKKERKSFENRGGPWRQKNQQPSTPQIPEGTSQLPINQNQHCNDSSHSFSTGQGFAGNTNLAPPFPHLFQAPGFIPPSGVWTNGMLWLQQNPLQQSCQMPLPNGLPFQQQFVQGPMLPPNLVSPGGQSNFGAGTRFGPWQGGFAPNSFNQALGIGWQSHQVPMAMNVGEQPHPFTPGNGEVPQQFNHGMSHGPGRKPYNNRGRGRFGGGRGLQQ